MTSSNSFKKFIIDTSIGCNLWVIENDKILDSFFTDEKPSKFLFKKISDFLENNNLEMDLVDSFYFCKGPGSYTGLRISDSLQKYLELQNLKVKTYFNYQILNVLDENYVFVSNAFKDEFFLAKKSDKISYQKVKKDLLSDYISSEKIVSFDSFDRNYFNLFNDKIFKFINFIDNEMSDAKKIFYYRTLEEEYFRK